MLILQQKVVTHLVFYAKTSIPEIYLTNGSNKKPVNVLLLCSLELKKFNQLVQHIPIADGFAYQVLGNGSA